MTLGSKKTDSGALRSAVPFACRRTTPAAFMAEEAAAEEGEEEKPQPVLPLTEEELEERQRHYTEIFIEVTANVLKVASLNERKEAELTEDKGLTYGELDFPTLHLLLNKVTTDLGPFFPSKGVFLDLGSGAGKQCIATALLHPFQKIIGIETLQSLHDRANTALEQFKALQLPEEFVRPEIEFIKGDFVAEFDSKLEPLAPEITVCLAFATCFGEAQLQAMAKLADKMPDGAVFITISQGLPEQCIAYDGVKDPARRRFLATKQALAKRGVDPDSVEIVVPPLPEPIGWMLRHTVEVELVWGQAACFIFQKVDPPKAEEPNADAEAEGGA